MSSDQLSASINDVKADIVELSQRHYFVNMWLPNNKIWLSINCLRKMFSENSYFCRTFALYIKKNQASNAYEQNICLKNVPKNEKFLETQEVQFYGQLTRRGS